MTTAREVCIKINNRLVCTSSPLRDCSCDRDADYKDPFPLIPETTDPGEMLKDIEVVLERAIKGGGIGATELAAKSHALMACARLLFAPGVEVSQPFLIMAMTAASPTKG